MAARPAGRASLARCALAGFALAAAVDLVAEFAGWGTVALAARAVLMPLLAGYAWLAATGRTRLLTLVTVALGFSWLGDFAGVTILLKIGFFLCAQMVYLVAFAPYWRRSVITRPPLLIGYLLAIGAVLAVAAAPAGPLAGPVAVYGASLAAMAVLATGVHRRTGLGAALFVLSDIVLAVEYFVAPGLIPHAAFVNMALYLPAQLLIVLGVLRVVEPTRPEAAPAAPDRFPQCEREP